MNTKTSTSQETGCVKRTPGGSYLNFLKRHKSWLVLIVCAFIKNILFICEQSLTFLTDRSFHLARKMSLPMQKSHSDKMEIDGTSLVVLKMNWKYSVEVCLSGNLMFARANPASLLWATSRTIGNNFFLLNHTVAPHRWKHASARGWHLKPLCFFERAGY